MLPLRAVGQAVGTLQNIGVYFAFWARRKLEPHGQAVRETQRNPQKMLQKMLGSRPKPEETIEQYMQRTSSVIKRIKTAHQLIVWDVWYHRLVFKWAGHIARIPSYDAARLTHKVLVHQNWRWIRRIAAENRGSQLHGKRLRTWRWERPIYKFFGDDCWEEVAQDKEAWTAKLDEMMLWRQQHR